MLNKKKSCKNNLQLFLIFLHFYYVCSTINNKPVVDEKNIVWNQNENIIK